MREACLCLLTSLLSYGATSAVCADDILAGGGVKITFDHAGILSQVKVAGAVMSSKPQACGVWVREAPRGSLLPVSLGARRDRATQLAAAGLRVTARIVPQETHLLVSGAVEDVRGGNDRGVDVVIRLPFPQAAWWPRISECLGPGQYVATARSASETLPQGAAVLERVERDGMGQDVLPVACVTDQRQTRGLALAIPPDFPCKFRFAYLPEPGCLELQFPLGLSSAATGALKSRAPFRFLIMACDGHWGLRDALRQYYALYPDAFRRKTNSSGLWLFDLGHVSFDQVPDPEHYAFWEGPILRELAEATKQKIETYPYIIVGQREITNLKNEPKSYEDVIDALRREPARRKPGGQSWEAVKMAVETSGLQDPRGRWVHLFRSSQWGGQSMTFPLNPSPFLPSQAGRPSVADASLRGVTALLQQYPDLSGIYVDSLASWGSYYNYRREHFAAARAPLAHDAAGQPCIPNWMPHVDFLHALHRQIGDRLVFGNGIRPGRAFCAFACDILGVETSQDDFRHRRNLDFYRAVGGEKPFLFLFYYAKDEIPRAVAEEYVQRFVAMGLSPEVRSNPWGRYKRRDADLLARFVPLYRRLDLAGWEPVTHARLDHESVWLERFGRHAPDLYFTVYNPDEKAVQVRLSLDRQALGLPNGSGLVELVKGDKLPAHATVALPPHSLRVIQAIKQSSGRCSD